MNVRVQTWLNYEESSESTRRWIKFSKIEDVFRVISENFFLCLTIQWCFKVCFRFEVIWNVSAKIDGSSSSKCLWEHLCFYSGCKANLQRKSFYRFRYECDLVFLSLLLPNNRGFRSMEAEETVLSVKNTKIII